MWKPPQKIKCPPQPGAWPSKEEAAHSRLFSPLKHGNLELAQRTWIPAMVPWRATEDGEVTDAVVEWYERFAMGRPGAIVVEATGIRDVPSGPLLRIGHDRYIDGLKRIVEAVKRASGGESKLYIQIIDFLSIRRRPDRDKFLGRFLRITAAHRKALGAEDWPEEVVREALRVLDDEALHKILSPREQEDLERGHRERVTDTEPPHIRDLPEVLPGLFADAARRAKEAGFDGVELHYAHAYTMASFLSRLNTRDDGYGGTPEARVRLPLEVYAACREAVGDDYVLGCRMLSEDCIDGGSTLEDTAFYAQKFAEAGMDFLSFSRGGKFEDALPPKVGEAIYPYTGPSGYECMPQFISDEQGPYGRNVEPVAHIRKVLKDAGLDTPMVVAGGIHGFHQAEDILQADKADVVGLARQAMADPDWFLKVKTGAGAAVNVCKYTNYCEGLDQKHKVVTCQLWDREALDEPGVHLTQDGKRRLTAPLWKR
ncbi:NADH:flavin oxidoreductase [Emcibacter nanhaiensis]|uniref:NADH:flavin oxidoreductase n=1 Tax=Emcibacter nanhaiensis TaxID=1505037 RepID=A0A501PGG6_9PROT|nr:NADH:flavin oxidoreductase [Emcibacter nanhaiensis]TPD59102.1 NADH:flavin oxidoreductase [Emcibacter nanhaiensis]